MQNSDGDDHNSVSKQIELIGTQLPPGSALQLRQSLYEKNRKAFTKNKLSSPQSHSDRDHRKNLFATNRSIAMTSRDAVRDAAGHPLQLRQLQSNLKLRDTVEVTSDSPSEQNDTWYNRNFITQPKNINHQSKRSYTPSTTKAARD